MKKALIIAVLVLCSTVASAQWYLFPGSPQAQADSTAVSCETVDTVSVADSVDVAEVDSFVLDIPKTIKLVLALPLGSTRPTPSTNFYDFYCGAMLAARDLGERGVNLNINVFDTNDAVTPLTSASLSDADIIIGPVGLSEIKNALPLCGEEAYIVSPLEPKVINLADTCRIVQVPCPNFKQIDDLVEWIQIDLESFDNLVLYKEPGIAPTASHAHLVEQLDKVGLKYQTVSTLGGLQFPVAGKNRIVVVSDNDTFLMTAIREASILGQKNSDAIVYTTSKVRSLDKLEPTALFDAQTRLVCSYQVDYSDASVRSFILAYRSLFGSEPGQFAFHGYDTVHYFINACSTYGRQWYKKLPDYSESGLQTGFRFEKSDSTGKVNTASRRVVYNKDMSMSLQ